MTDLADTLRGFGRQLAPKSDPALVEGLELLRLTLDVDGARAAWEYEQRRPAPKPDRKSGWCRGGQPRCAVCKHFIPTAGSDCGSCGYRNGGGGFAAGFGGN